MPEVSRFYGIIIKMFFSDHQPPHFHVVYNDFNAVFNIDTLEMIEGDLPSRASSLVKEWAALYQTELKNIWNTQDFTKLPGLK